jgi:hypothetical protein
MPSAGGEAGGGEGGAVAAPLNPCFIESFGAFGWAFGWALVEKLAVPVEWPRLCDACEGETTFKAEFRSSLGLIGFCGRCGEPKIAPWTRAESGVE